MTYHQIKSFQARANAKRSRSEQAADWMTNKFGSIQFLLINFAMFVLWMVINLGWIPLVPAIDPYPFPMLTTIVSLEAIFLAIVVLISQNRAAHIADIREEIDLQLDLITEREVTKVMELVTYVAQKDGRNLADDKTLQEMLKQLDVNKMGQLLERQLK